MPKGVAGCWFPNSLFPERFFQSLRWWYCWASLFNFPLYLFYPDTIPFKIHFSKDPHPRSWNLSFPKSEYMFALAAVSSRKRKRNELSVFEDGVSMNTMSMMSHPYARMIQQNDDVDSFFHGLAQTMKKLRPLTVAKLKKEIANMVTDAEIRELEEADSKFALTENGYWSPFSVIIIIIW